MKEIKPYISVLIILVVFLIIFPVSAQQANIKLSQPNTKNGLSAIIQSRASNRAFKKRALTKEQVSSLIWSAGGLKVDALSQASRTIPSAGATYPLEFYLVVGENSVNGIEKGIYHYLFKENSLELLDSIDTRNNLAAACLNQKFISDAPISIIVIADYSRTTQRYRDRGIRYVHMEAGHACQNIYLMATDLGLSTVEVGAFNDEEVKKILNLSRNFEPLIVMPVGYSE